MSRRLARNEWCDLESQPVRAYRRTFTGGYRLVLAHQSAALDRARGGKPFCLVANDYLRPEAQKPLRQRYTPEQIAGILPRIFQDNSSLHANHKTIYKTHSAMLRKARRPRTRAEVRRNEILNTISVNQRPPKVEECVIPSDEKVTRLKAEAMLRLPTSSLNVQVYL